jgi:hypothetical protein
MSRVEVSGAGWSRCAAGGLQGGVDGGSAPSVLRPRILPGGGHRHSPLGYRGTFPCVDAREYNFLAAIYSVMQRYWTSDRSLPCAVLPGVAGPFSSLPSVSAAETAQLH